MKLPNRISFSRIVIALIICIILLFPFDSAGLTTLKIFVNESIVVDIKYIIVGVLLLLYLFTFSVCHAASKESRHEEIRQKELHNKSEPTDKNS